MIRSALFIGLFITVGAAGAEKFTPATEFQGMPLVFSEDFEKGCATWAPTDEKAWKIMEESGNKVFSLFQSSAYKPVVRSPQSIAWLKDIKVSDFVLEAQVKQTGKEYGHRDFCVFFGYVDPSHFYYVHLATKSDEHANSIFLVNGAPRVSIAKERTDGTAWDDQYHTVRVVRTIQTGRIEVFRDDMTKPIMMAEDKTFTAGGIGFGSFDDTGNVDNVALWGSKP